MYWSLSGLTRNFPTNAGYPSETVATAYTSAAQPNAKRGAGGAASMPARFGDFRSGDLARGCAMVVQVDEDFRFGPAAIYNPLGTSSTIVSHSRAAIATSAASASLASPSCTMNAASVNSLTPRPAGAIGEMKPRMYAAV